MYGATHCIQVKVKLPLTTHFGVDFHIVEDAARRHPRLTLQFSSQ